MTTAPTLTNAGIDLLARAISGETIAFSFFKIGNGNTPSDIASMTDIVNPLISFEVRTIDKSQSGFVKFTGSFDNSQITDDFRWKELGIFCQGETQEEITSAGTTNFVISSAPAQINKVTVNGDVATISSYDSSTGTVTLSSATASGDTIVVFFPDGNDVLFAYANDGENGGMLKAGLTDVVSEQSVTIVIAISNADNVTIILNQSQVYVTKTEFENHLAAENPHNITKETVGLGNVENTALENQTPAIEDVATLRNFIQGDKIKHILGCTKKAIKSLIDHLRDVDNPHEVDCEQIGAAEEDHTHSTSDLTSGTLSVERGGTGANSKALALRNMLSGVTTLPGTTSANTITYPTICFLENRPELPTTDKYFLIVFVQLGYVLQIAMGVDGEVMSATRTQIGGRWTEWRTGGNANG